MANKALGLGLNFEPASVTKMATDELRQLLAKGKLLLGQTAGSAIEAGRVFSLAKELCPTGQWEKTLREMGLSPRTVRWAIAKFLKQTPDIGDAFLDEDDAPKKDKGGRDAGDDSEPWEKQLRRLKSLHKHLELMARTKAVSREVADGAFRSLDALCGYFTQLGQAPPKPPPAIVEKLCDHCGGAIQLVPTPKGKVVALNAHPGRGRFIIEAGFAVVCKYGGQYAMHRLTCVGHQEPQFEEMA